MKNIILILLLFIGNGDKITKISKANEAKEKAEVAFNNGKYGEAIKNYTYLLDSLDYEDPKAKLNLAHAFHLSNDTSSAIQTYNSLLTSANREVKSIAHQQLGVISKKSNDLKTALAHFKNALKANPQNKEARFNYELVKKKLAQQENQDKDQDQKKEDEKEEDKKDEKEEKKDEDKKDQDKKGEKEEDKKDGEKKDQEKKDQEKKEGEKGEKGEKDKKEQEKKDEKGEGEKSEEEKKKEEKEKGEKGEDGEPKEDEKKDDKGEKPMTPEEKKKQEEQAKQQAQQQRFDKVDMSEAKAKMILNAMKQGEKQYLQQLKKQPTKRQDSDKPDW